VVAVPTRSSSRSVPAMTSTVFASVSFSACLNVIFSVDPLIVGATVP
jgi:hypothetical protein